MRQNMATKVAIQRKAIFKQRQKWVYFFFQYNVYVIVETDAQFINRATKNFYSIDWFGYTCTSENRKQSCEINS